MKFESHYKIGDEVKFSPSGAHVHKYGIAKSLRQGTIVAVRFTKSKVFYDIVDDYFGFMFDNLDSALIKDGV